MTDVSLPPGRADLEILVTTALAIGGESHRFDFKESLDLSNEEHKLRLVRAAGAFGNTDEGGFILVGISDDRRVVGLSDDLANAFDQTRVQRILGQYLTPAPVVQVRQHRRDGVRVVVIEVQSFVSAPSFVRQSATYGDEHLFAGTVLFRTRGAESAVLTSESDVNALCGAIVRRRASDFLELLQRGQFGQPPPPPIPIPFADLEALQRRANAEWSRKVITLTSQPGSSRPFVEVGFATGPKLALSVDQLRAIVPGAVVPVQHGFPFVDVIGGQVHEGVSWGWYGRIPFAHLDAGAEAPTYLWLLSRDGAFVDRDRLWEDDPRSVITGGIGLFHLIGRVILLLRLVLNYADVLALDSQLRFRVHLAVYGAKGRFLDDETHPGRRPTVKGAEEDRVEARHELSLAALRKGPRQVAMALLQEIAWLFARHDLTRHDLESAMRAANGFLGKEYHLGAMCWRRVEVLNSDVAEMSATGLMTEFVRRFNAAGQPGDARVFRDERATTGFVYYFSPRASFIAEDLLDSFNATRGVEPPDTDALTPQRF